jgi:DNA-binding NarL/FixJ family response regulator
MKAERSPAHFAAAITVLLVDDHVLVRRAFRRILDDEAQITVVGEASDGVEAVRMVCDLKPRVVLMDWVMPNMNGLVATKKILQAFPEMKVLMLSMHSSVSWVRKAIEAGARGYILKDDADLDLGSTIKRIAAGDLVFTPRLFKESGERSGRRKLTTRELEILQLILNGKSNKEIAAHLNLSANTVGAHRSRIMNAVGVRKTADLVVYAMRKRLVNIV